VEHNCKVALCIIKGDVNSFSFGFINDETIMEDLSHNESCAMTAVRMAKKYIDADLDWINLAKVNFYTHSVEPKEVDAKTGKALGETMHYTYLLYRAKISRSLKTSEEINWVKSSNHEKLAKIPFINFHLQAVSV
tara:strand:+ start:27 stop:431 length:405 start_codon:yes stop_codon:yes gene_type:complete